MSNIPLKRARKWSAKCPQASGEGLCPVAKWGIEAGPQPAVPRGALQKERNRSFEGSSPLLPENNANPFT